MIGIGDAREEREEVMTIVPEHARRDLHDLELLRCRLTDSVPALVGCVCTVADRASELNDEVVLDLLTRALRRLDQASALSGLVSDLRLGAIEHDHLDALSVLKMSLWILVTDWMALPGEERHHLIGVAARVARSALLPAPEPASSAA